MSEVIESIENETPVVDQPFIVEDDQVFINEEAVEEKFHIHVTGGDTLGFGWLENVVKIANMGGVIKPGTIPATRFPHSASMVTVGVHPVPSATVRVFEYDTNKEIFAAFVEPTVSTFSLNVDDGEDTVDKSTNNGTPWTKEQLEAMDWETEFKEVCSASGITGRSRAKMTKEYLAKYA